MNVELVSETYRMQWELYEGSIALVQLALVWKEVSTQSDLQITIASGGDKSSEVLRIRRIWQLANNKAVYDDEEELTVEQLSNDFANNEYVNPAP